MKVCTLMLEYFCTYEVSIIRWHEYDRKTIEHLVIDEAASESNLNDFSLTVNKLNNNMFPVTDGICADVLKYGGDKMFGFSNI